MKDSPLYIIVAVADENGIGKDGVMPWSFTKEMQHFKQITTSVKDKNKKNALIMGRTTWYSLPEKFRPLKDRKNVVLTFELDQDIAQSQFHTLEDAIKALKKDEHVENIFIIGGASVYRYTVENIDLDGLYITRVNKYYDCDTFFPEIPAKYGEIEKLGEAEEDGVKFDFLLYKKA